jgi:hypothetical protein
LTSGEETIGKKQDYCAGHATKKTGRLSRLIPADSLPKVSRNERAYNSQDGRQNKTPWLTFVARHDELGNHANDKPNDNCPKDALIALCRELGTLQPSRCATKAVLT